MAFSDDLAALQATVYTGFGVPATWTIPGGSPQPLTLLPAKPDDSAWSGAHWDERPAATAANHFKVRTSELTALGLVTMDTASRQAIPTWNGATVNLGDGIERTMPRPKSADPRHLEWIISLQ
jgi:hypothetical protein